MGGRVRCRRRLPSVLRPNEGAAVLVARLVTSGKTREGSVLALVQQPVHRCSRCFDPIIPQARGRCRALLPQNRVGTAALGSEGLVVSWRCTTFLPGRRPLES